MIAAVDAANKNVWRLCFYRQAGRSACRARREMAGIDFTGMGG